MAQVDGAIWYLAESASWRGMAAARLTDSQLVHQFVAERDE